MICSLSYQRFVHVPTWVPFFRSYVPHKKFAHKSARFSGAASSKHTTNRALSTTSKHDSLFLLVMSALRRLDQILRFSVDSTPIAFRATCSQRVED